MNTANIHILLVEDNPDHAELLRRCLENAALNTHVHHVEDGETALDYIFAQKKFSDRSQFPAPDLVLLDLRLPRLDGIEVLKQVKNHPATQSLPVVVLTTSDAEHDLNTAIRLQANKFLTKPADAQTVKRLLLDFGLLSAPGVAGNNISAQPQKRTAA
jgi:CheY-like chemotaxis protein